jgi:fructose-bisphosphate aldolase class II
MLVHLSKLLKDAQSKKYALGAFNVENLETTLGVVRAAKKLKSPVVLQVSETSIQYAGLKAITAIVETIARDEAGDVPIALHLDHGRSFRSVAECVRQGFSSIMMDASDRPFTENIILTQQAVDYAHKKEVLVQGELGMVKGLEEVTAEERKKMMTDPDDAEEFVAKTGVDTLAVAVGNVHGIIKIQKGNPELDFERLSVIHGRLPKTPLVLHGASGLPARAISEGIKYGVRIINIDTDLRLAFTTVVAVIRLSDPAALQQVVEEKLVIFGSARQI